MKKEETYDVIIIGAGPAGLSLASVLSQEHKICVIEKNKIGTTTKSWASFKDLIKKLHLENCIKNEKTDTLEFAHYLGAKWKFKDCYCQLNETSLLKEFIKRCNKKNTTFIENCKINSHARKDNKMYVKSRNRILEAKLLIDCAGADSPILKKYKLKKRYTSNSILGYTLKKIKINPRLFIWEIIKTPRYKEIMVGGIMPYSDNVAQVHVFPYLRNKLKEKSFLKKYLIEYINQHPGLKGAKIVSKTEGDILMGDLKKNALDNVFFFGESGFWTPVFIGIGLNNILINYQRVGKELSRLIKENRLSENVLSEIKPLTEDERMKHFLRCFDNIVISLKNNPERINKFILTLKDGHPQFGKYLMRNKYNAAVLRKTWEKIHEHFTIKELTKMLPKKDILYLFELGAELIEDSVLKKYRKHLKDI